MIRPSTKLRFGLDANDMRKKVRKEFDSTCIATGSAGGSGMYTVCAAHVFPASTFQSVKACLENGLPLIAMIHNYPIMENVHIQFLDGDRLPHTEVGCLDKTTTGSDRKPLDRLAWLVDYLPSTGWNIAAPRLKLLISEASQFDREIRAMEPEAMSVLSRRDEALEILEQY